MTKKRKPLREMGKDELAETLFGKKLKKKLEEIAHQKDPKPPSVPEPESESE